jgi:hypothetical protein
MLVSQKWWFERERNMGSLEVGVSYVQKKSQRIADFLLFCENAIVCHCWTDWWRGVAGGRADWLWLTLYSIKASVRLR